MVLKDAEAATILGVPDKDIIVDIQEMNLC